MISVIIPKAGDDSMKVFLIKYGELTTKKGNRNFFVKKLRSKYRKRFL